MDLCQIASAKEVHTPFFDTLLIFHSNIILRRTVELALYIFLLLHILSEITRPFLAFHFTIWALKKTKKRPISDVIFRLLTTPLKKMYFVWPWNILKWTCILIFIFREIQWSFIQFVKKSWWLKNWDLTVIFKKFLFVYLWEYIAMNLLFLNKVDDQKRYMHLFSIQSGLRNWFIVLYNKKSIKIYFSSPHHVFLLEAHNYILRI